jgi:hypothetical protein
MNAYSMLGRAREMQIPPRLPERAPDTIPLLLHAFKRTFPVGRIAARR